MRQLKVLLYGDVDLNIMDGSAIWLTSMANLVGQDQSIKADVLLKSRIKNDRLVKEMINIPNVNVIEPFKQFDKSRFENGNRMKIEEAINIMEEIDREKEYHLIMVRGLDLVKKLMNSVLISKIIPYITNFTHDIEMMGEEERLFLQNVYQLTPKMFVQTVEMKEYLKEALSISGEKFEILYPMIPNIEEEPDFRNKNHSLVYTGKFASGWYTEEILSAFEELHRKDELSILNVAGDKFQGDLASKKNQITKTLKSGPGINWLGGISRSASNELINRSDVGISWRSSEIDHDKSLELSTKLLEYGRLGKPVLLRRTKMHENLLGNDYPLFVESKDEFIKSSYLVLNDRRLYSLASRRIHEAVKMYTFNESYKRLKNTLWSFNNDKIRLLFAGHDLKFIQMAIKYFEQNPQFEVKIDQWDGHNYHNEKKSLECLQWADVIFCEWGLGNTVWYSKHKLEHQKLVVRMHLQERDTNYPKGFTLSNIDQIIAISPYIFEEFHRVCSIPRNKMTMIYNMINTKQFDLPKVDSDVNYHLGIVGILPSRKRLDRALNILEKLYSQDNRYKLFIKSKRPEEVSWVWDRDIERKYFNEVYDRIKNEPWGKNVIFEGHGSNMDEWFQKIGYVLSTSDFESFHLAPMEGMAGGSIPIVLHWTGAETIYQNEYLFNNEEEAVKKITNEETQRLIGSSKLKQYPSENFDKEIICSQIETLILSL
ncbi:group 1 glycosyl transferase [Gottfriedia acidiceleris]|uniref:group 1 glycosyl transferase n=1 Tax=Gottfriedia acidiceleris TaxID=371036 RepID=UPI0033951899